MKQNKSILFLTRLYHPHIGGVEKHVEEISTLLKARGFFVTIVTEQFDIKLPLYEELRGLRIFRIPIGRNRFFKKFLIWKWILSHINLFVRADIIHVHDVFFWMLPIRILIPLKKVYITFHGYEGYPIKAGWKVQRKIAELLTNGNICVGIFMKKWYKTRPTLVIYGGVRVEGKKRAPDPQTAVFFGRLDNQTGILEYINAYQDIKKKFPKFRLTVVGQGELRSQIPPEVKVLGFKKKVEPYILENRFIFVSRYLSMLEALASNREIIATFDNPIKKDYLLMSPFKKYIFVGSNGHDIAKYVIKNLSKKGASNQTQEGTDWALAQTWEKVVENYLRLWKIVR